MPIILIVLVIIFTLILIKSADTTVVSIKKIAHGSSTMVVSVIVIAIGTAFPEIFVSIASAFEGKGSLSLGVALGANITNIALVGAGAALISGKVHIKESILKKVFIVSFICGFLPYLLLIDGNLSRVDGVILLSVYLFYILSFFKGYHQIALAEQQKGIYLTKLIKRVEHFAEEKWKSLLKIFLGVFLMVIAADTIVKFSTLLAENLNIPLFIIGLFVLAIGTSLPEFAFSLESLRDKEPEMFVGNLMGSVVANSTLVIGISAIVRPLTFLNVGRYFFPGIIFLSTYILFYYFVRTKKKLDRWEAGVLILIYILFFLIEL